jgi:hypothetical protein
VARPGRLELPTLCLEGRRSIQLSYGRAANSDSKAFTTGINTVLDALTFCRKGRHSRQLRYTPFLVYSFDSTKVTKSIRQLILSKILEQLGAIGKDGTVKPMPIANRLEPGIGTQPVLPCLGSIDTAHSSHVRLHLKVNQVRGLLLPMA